MASPQKEIAIIARKTNGRCFYCNEFVFIEAFNFKEEYCEIDHFISKSKWREWDLENTPEKGNLNHLKNLFLSCRLCNRRKKAQCPEDFIGNPWKIWGDITEQIIELDYV